ncbi:MAG: HD-GYP domain-containing protein [Acidihalobacter sp.]|uniref:HD-GYP domain-containing protein n=1 Tax=Acidihalobacter sp. TaxID=1872108 RepID=UPI00307DD04D
MLKKISLDQVRLGMFIQSFEGDWLSHPFWKTKFLLDQPGDLKTLRDSGIPGVWIDIQKGLDVASAEAASPEQAPPPLPPPERVPAKCSAAEETHRAKKILSRSKQAVTNLFNEARLGKAVDVESCLPVVEEISESVARNSAALISLARLKTRDEYTYVHSVSVCALMVALTRQIGLNDAQTRETGLAGLLHDVGKMAIPEDVLNKPSKLTDEEFAVMKSHPERGYEILIKSGMQSEGTLDVCLHHHEKIDGSGYPHHLQHEQIGLYARMGAICDVYDAITSNRPYKDAWDASESLVRMAKWEGHFDPQIFHTFIKSVGIYPLSSLVRLESGRLGVVIEQTPGNLTKPVLRVFFSTKSNAAIPMQILDLSKNFVNDRIAGREDPHRWDFKNLEKLWH